jgi:TolB-like protein/DNA-binding winged helix-turn-helix (wHTH) protein/Flp pilus assembly protein TadD
MSKRTERFYEFGPFRVNVTERILLKEDRILPIRAKVFDILLLLIENRGHLVEKEVLLRTLWPNTFVEESSLVQNIYILRKVLGERGSDHQYIQTVSKYGYRFISDVREVTQNDAEGLINQPAAEQGFGEDEAAHETCVPANEGMDARHDRAPAPRRFNKLGRPLILYALILGITLTTFLWLSHRQHKQPEISSIPRSIAVLPFRLIGSERNNELLGLGMADALTNKLSGLHRIRVLPASSVSKYEGDATDPQAAGRELGVDAVLHGTVQSNGDRVRITAQLIHSSDGQTLWAGKFDEQLNDIFNLQDSISDQLVEALSIKLAKDEREQMMKRFTNSPEAYQAYLWGLYYRNKRTHEGLNKATEHFQQATGIDRNYALAYAMLADTYCLVSYYYENDSPSLREVYQKAKEAASRALELDEMLAEAHSALGFIKQQFENDPAGATVEHRSAVELNPNLALARLRYAWILARMGEIEQAIGQAKRGQQIDPLSFPNNLALGQLLIYARSPDEAVYYLKLTRAIEPEVTGALSGAVLVGLSDAYLLKGEQDKAILQLQKLETNSGYRIYALGMLGWAHAAAGRPVEARKIVRKIQGLPPSSKDAPYSLAMIYGALGQKDQGFYWLEKAITARQVKPVDLLYDYKFDALRDDPRYAELLRRNQLKEMIFSTSKENNKPNAVVH